MPARAHAQGARPPQRGADLGARLHRQGRQPELSSADQGRISLRDEARAAARLVLGGAADEELAFGRDEALRARARRAAARADRVELGDVLGDGQERRHRAEGPAAPVLVEPAAITRMPRSRERLEPRRRCRRRRTAPRRCRRPPCPRATRASSSAAVDDRHRVGVEPLVRHDLHLVVAVVDARLEEQHALPGEPRPLDAPQELLGLAAEHRAADDLDPAVGGARHRPGGSKRCESGDCIRRPT